MRRTGTGTRPYLCGLLLQNDLLSQRLSVTRRIGFACARTSCRRVVVYFALEPEVAGQLGDTTMLDTSVHPPVIQRLEYRFDGWLGDDLLESFPCFVVTERLANELKL